jgi:uncharacterized HAD superfamily protein
LRPEEIDYRSYDDMARLIRSALPWLFENNFDLVVGVPRSGMLPATLIAQYLNAQVCTIQNFLANLSFQHVGLRSLRFPFDTPHEAQNILIVEDCYANGVFWTRLLSRIHPSLRMRVKTLSIFSHSRTNPSFLDKYLEYVPDGALFEWNIFHHSRIIPSAAFDLDGVLCADPSSEQDDDEEEYRKFLENASPRILPTGELKAIVTSRLGKYRPQTEQWLKKYNIRYQALHMLEGCTWEERRDHGLAARFKARQYQQEHYRLFFESNFIEAIAIHNMTGKPVFCVDKNVLIKAQE